MAYELYRGPITHERGIVTRHLCGRAATSIIWSKAENMADQKRMGAARRDLSYVAPRRRFRLAPEQAAALLRVHGEGRLDDSALANMV